jgi:hypothetical protein
MTGYAIVLLARSFHGSENLFLLGVSCVMLVLEIWIVLEAAALVIGMRRENQKEQPPA